MEPYEGPDCLDNIEKGLRYFGAFSVSCLISLLPAMCSGHLPSSPVAYVVALGAGVVGTMLFAAVPPRQHGASVDFLVNDSESAALREAFGADELKRATNRAHPSFIAGGIAKNRH